MRYCNIYWRCIHCKVEENNDKTIRAKWICENYNVELEIDDELRIKSFKRCFKKFMN